MVNEKDKVERMKLLVSGIVGNLAYNVIRLGGKGPVNPFVGETYGIN